LKARDRGELMGIQIIAALATGWGRLLIIGRINGATIATPKPIQKRKSP